MSRLLARFRRAAVKPFVLLAALIPIAGGGVLAYNFFFNRPGESAIQLLPQDALVVVTLDTNPSPEQAVTFKRILDAVEREGLLPEMDKALTEVMDKSPVAAELRPHLSKSFALAALKGPEGGNPDMAVLLAVKQADKVAAILGKHGAKATEEGVELFALRKPETRAALIGPYLVLSDRAAPLARIQAVQRDKSPSLDKSPDYQQARASLPKDANLMVFVSPAGMKELADQVKEAAGVAAPETRFFTLGLTVRDSGLEITGQLPTADKPDSPFARLADMAPLDPTALDRLPPGALGVFALSQPGKLWAPVRQAMGPEDAGDEMDEALEDFEDETGLSVERDVVPALGGNLVAAVYPDAEKPTESADVLIVVDESGGANPAELAEKLRLKVESEEDVEFVGEPTAGHKSWYLSEPVEGKSLCYGEVGKTVFLSSNRDLLRRALEAQSGGAAGGEALPSSALAGMRKALLPGAQLALMVDLRGVLNTFRKPLEEAMADLEEEKLTFDDVAGIFGGGDPGLTLSGKYDRQVAAFQLFIPLDYDRVIRLAGMGARKLADPNSGVRLQPSDSPEVKWDLSH
jgi:hypothetical protein